MQKLTTQAAMSIVDLVKTRKSVERSELNRLFDSALVDLLIKSGKLMESGTMVTAESFGGVVACANCDWTGQFDEINGNCPECGSTLVAISPPNAGDPMQIAGDNEPGNVTVVNSPVYAQQTQGYAATGKGSRGRDDSGDDVIFPAEEGPIAGWEADPDGEFWMKPLLPDSAKSLYEAYGDDDVDPMAAVKSLTMNDTISLDTEKGELILAKDHTGRYLAMIEPSVELAVMVNNLVKPVGTPPSVADRMVEETSDPREIFKKILAGAEVKETLQNVQEGGVKNWLISTVDAIMDMNGLNGQRSWSKIHDAIMNSNNVKVGDNPEQVQHLIFTAADIRQIKKTDMFESTVQEARSSTIRLSTLDTGDEVLLTLDKAMGKIAAGLVQVVKLPLKTAKPQGASWNPVSPADFKYRINDRFGNEVVLDYAKAMEVLR
jgi:Zn finger protein HypA/HybF involved in hydrogenase expression